MDLLCNHIEKGDADDISLKMTQMWFFFPLEDRRSADRFSCLLISIMLTVLTGGSCVKHMTRSFMDRRCLQNVVDAS